MLDGLSIFLIFDRTYKPHLINTMRKQPLQLFSAYLGLLFKFAGFRVARAAGLLLISGLLQGFSLLMLIPLLGLSGLSSSSAGTDPISLAVETLMSQLGISYSLAGVLIFFLLIIAAEAIFTRYRTIVLNALSLDFTNHLRNALYQKISSASWQFHSQSHSSESMHLLDNAVRKIGAGTSYTLQLFVLIFQAMVYLFVASRLSVPMTLAMLVSGFLLYALIIPVNRKVFLHGEKTVKASQALYRNMVDFFSSLKLAKSYNRTGRHIKEFEQTGKTLLSHEKAVVAASASAQMWLRIFSVSLLCGFVYIALSYMHMGIERVLVLIVVVNRLHSVFASGQSLWQALLQTLPGFDTWQQAMQTFERHEEPRQSVDTPLPPLKNNVRLEDICFQYQGDSNRPVLRDVSITFPANKTTAISGPSGSGKSTLADILMGLLLPDSGKVYVDDTPLTPDLLSSWREHIAYVPQDASLFDGSIRANLQWISDESFSDEQLWAALDAASAGDFIRQLPGQLDTLAGERGVKLSGGERQRIALARALLKKPALLILDEATSALDQQNEGRILDALAKLQGHMAIIIIAHRQSTIEHADSVVSLEL